MGVVVRGAFAVDNPFRVQLEKSTIPTFLSDELWIIEEAWRGGVDTNALKTSQQLASPHGGSAQHLLAFVFAHRPPPKKASQ